MIRFKDWDRDINITSSEARDRIDAIRSELPDDLQRYFVQNFSPSDQPILRIRFSSDRDLRKGQGWSNYGTIPIGLEAHGATLGLVGLGRIGGRVAEIARVLGMRVLAYDPFAAPARAQALAASLGRTR